MKLLNYCKLLLFSFTFIFSFFAQELPNGGFEFWKQKDHLTTPFYWLNNGANLCLTSQGSHSGNFSAELRCIKIDSLAKLECGHLWLGKQSKIANSMFLNAFNFSPDSLVGWYKLYSVFSQDSLFDIGWSVKCGIDNIELNTVAYLDYVNTTPSIEWKRFSIPFKKTSYSNPNELLLSFQVKNVEGTILKLDDIQFIYNHQSSSMISTLIYPNPSNSYVSLQPEKSILFYDLIDIKGDLIQHIPVENQTTITINISNLPIGTYFLRNNIGFTHRFDVSNN